MATQDVKVVYTADVEQYNQSLSEAMMATDRYAQVIDNAVGAISKLGMAATKSFTSVASAFMLPKGASTMNPAIQLAAQYEQAMSTLSAKAKVSGQDMRQLGKDVREMSREYPISMGQSVAQFESMLKAGLQGEELADVTEEMIALGAATGEMSTQLTESMTQFARTFESLDTTGVDALTDSVTTLSATNGASATAILEFSNAIAPLAKQLGMTSTEVLGFSTAFAKAGEEGMRAAGVFNTMLADMEKAVRTGAPQIQYYAEAVGMTTEEFTALAAADPAEAMIQFFEAIESGGDASIRILEQLGFDGVRAMKSITAVAESGDIREMVEQAEEAYASGSTELASEEAFNGLADSISKVKESMTQMVEAGAKPMVTIMGEIANVAAGVSSAFASLVQTDLAQFIIGAGTVMAVGGKMAGSMSAIFGTAAGVSKMAGEGAVKVPGARAAAFGATKAAYGANRMIFGPGITSDEDLETAKRKQLEWENGQVALAALATQGYDNDIARAKTMEELTETEMSDLEDRARKSQQKQMRAKQIAAGGLIGGALLGSPALAAVGAGAWWYGSGRSGLKTGTEKGVSLAMRMMGDTSGSMRMSDILQSVGTQEDLDIVKKMQKGEALTDKEAERLKAVTGSSDPNAKSTKGMYAFAGMTVGAEFADIATRFKSERGGKAFNIGQNVQATLYGLPAGGYERVNRGDLTHEWTQEEIKQRNEDIKERDETVKASGNSWRQARHDMGRGLNSVIQPFITMGGFFANVGKGLIPKSFTGAAIQGGLLLAGGLAYGSRQQDQAKEAASLTEMFAASVGEATAATTKFSESVSKASTATSTMSSAMDVTAEEMSVVTSDQYTNALQQLIDEGTTAEQAAMATAATMQYQPAALQEEWVNALAGIFGEAEAEAIAEKAFSGEYNPVEALGMLIENQKAFGSELWSGGLNQQEFLGEMRYNIARSDDMMQVAKATGESLNAAMTKYSEVYGSADALAKFQEEVLPAIFTAAGTGAVPKEEIKAVLESTLGLTTDQIDEFANAVDQQTKDIAKAYDRGLISQEDAAAAVEALWTETAQNTEWWTGTADTEGMAQKVEEAKKEVQSFAEVMAETGSMAAIAADEGLKAIEAQGLTAQEALDQQAAFEHALEQQEAGVVLEGEELEKQQAALAAGPAMTTTQYNVLSAAASPEAAATQAYKATMGGLGALAGTQDMEAWRQQQIAKFQGAGTYRLQEGELSTEQMQWVTNQYSTMQANLQKYTGSLMSSSQARKEESKNAAAMAASAIDYDEALGHMTLNFSDNADAAKMQAEAIATLGDNLLQGTTKVRSFGKAAYEMEVQQQYMMEDYALQAQYAYEDAALQQARATEDFHLQQARAEEDFRIQQTRATEDYNKSVMRAEEDFNKQMLRAEEDYYRQVEYAEEDFQKQMTRMQEDFEKSMTRAAEDMAWGMMDPYQRIGSERVWSASGIIQNIEEQNQLIKDQLDALAELTARGLSEDAIKMLGLNDPKNARQVVYLKDMTDAQIEELNRLAAERAALGEAMWEESTEYERAYEDYMTNLTRMQEDFMIQMQRMNEEFLLQQQRATEDYNQQMARAAEDFNQQMMRMTEDFNRQMLRMEEDFEKSMDRMWEDVQRNLDRQYEQMMIQIERMEEALVQSFTEVQVGWTQMLEMTRTYMEENGINYSEFNKNLMEDSSAATEEVQRTTIEDMTKVTEEEMKNVTETAEESERELARVGEHLGDVVDEEVDDIRRGTNEVETFTTSAITDMDRAGENSTTNIENVFNKLMDSITNTTVGMPEEIKRNMGDFAWILEWPLENGSENEKFITIRMDAASFEEAMSHMGGGMEALQGAAGMAQGVPPQSSAGSGDLYVTGGVGSVSQQYGVPNSRYSAGYHTGIDISAPQGTPLYATIAGTVTKSYMDSSYGNMVEIDDAASGTNVMYAHMTTRAVSPGAKVERGVNIGKVGSTGNSTGPHVHVEARQSPYKYGNDVSPMPYLRMGAIVNGTTQAVIGEAGPEVLIPLNDSGAGFLANLLNKYRGNPEVQGLRTAGYSIVHNTNQSTTINDSRVVTGPVTVMSRDPDQFYSAMRAKTRKDRLGSKV